MALTNVVGTATLFQFTRDTGRNCDPLTCSVNPLLIFVAVGAIDDVTGTALPPLCAVNFTTKPSKPPASAIAAHRGHDYRKAILYAAMSAEIAFGTVIDETYERLVMATGDQRFRVISLSQAGGVLRQKDPIYELLRRRSDFNTLIHELSLYVFGRSLLVEDEVLYQGAKRLYSTRNKLAHTGQLPEDEVAQLFALDQAGSLAAQGIAVSLLAWLGQPADFPLPDWSLVTAKDQPLAV